MCIRDSPLYSPDLAPNDFAFFAESERLLLWHHGKNQKRNAGMLDGLQELDFVSAFEAWKRHWN